MHVTGSMFSRGLILRLGNALADTPVIYLAGARQVGKSTLAASFASSRRYVTLDNVAELSAARADPVGFIAAREADGGIPVVIDEVQRAPDLLLSIKASVDRDRRPGRFLLTGSANILSLPRISETLAGRIEVLVLRPLTRCEINGTASPLRVLLEGKWMEIPDSPFSRDALIEWARIGGFPEVLMRVSTSRRRAWFVSYVTTTVAREVRAISEIGNDATIGKMLHFVATRAGGPRNIESLAHDSGTPATTVRRYLACLRTIYLIDEIPAWFVNVDKRLTKHPKLLLVDSGIYDHLVGGAADPGPLLETFVGCELQRLIGLDEEPMVLHHFRTSRGAEVDWVIERANGSIVGIEVKAAATVTAADFRGLHVLREAAGKRFSRGIVLFTGQRAVAFAPDLLAIPLGVLG